MPVKLKDFEVLSSFDLARLSSSFAEQNIYHKLLLCGSSSLILLSLFGTKKDRDFSTKCDKNKLMVINC